MKVVGLDLSLTSTGVAEIGGHVMAGGAMGPGQYAVVDRIRTKAGDGTLTARGARLRTIRSELGSWVNGADLVVVEGLAYASNSPHASERAGLWWLVVDHLLRLDIPTTVVSPAARAKYATGKGNAGKDEVLAAVVRRYPDVETRGNDEADALVLAAMGARAQGHPIDDLPKTHTDAMAKVAWPEFPEVTA